MLWPHPIFLPTDIMIWLFAIGVIGCVYKVRASQPLCNLWGQLLAKPLYNGCAIILLVFSSIALLDSIHFKKPLATSERGQPIYSNEVNSVLDTVISPLGTVVESSYSAPFATHSLNKSYHRDAQQRYVSSYSPLELTQNAPSIWTLTLHFLSMLALIALSACIVVGCYYHFRKQTWLGAPAARYALLFGGLLIALLSYLLVLSHHYHVFGTNKIGEDVLYQTIKSIRTGIIIGTVTTFFSVPLAITLGIAAGYFGKRVDDCIQYIYTTVSAIPSILLISAAILSLQVWLGRHAAWFTSMEESADMRLLLLCAILGLTGWTALCRLLRGETLKIRELDYITAAKTLGVSNRRIIFRHILPNVMHLVLIISVIDFSGLVLAEAVLSYVGVGVAPSTISWGNMINSARLELAREPAIWWSLAAAFTFMFTLVLAANIVADGVRDIFDPRETQC
jgi:peptide/nickel transport system permease protein